MGRETAHQNKSGQRKEIGKIHGNVKENGNGYRKATRSKSTMKVPSGRPIAANKVSSCSSEAPNGGEPPCSPVGQSAIKVVNMVSSVRCLIT